MDIWECLGTSGDMWRCVITSSPPFQTSIMTSVILPFISLAIILCHFLPLSVSAQSSLGEKNSASAAELVKLFSFKYEENLD